MDRLADPSAPGNGQPRENRAGDLDLADGASADAQRRLAAAAVECFAEHGFHGTTTRAIANAAGMSSAGLYIHHSSKEELLYRISLHGHQVALQVITDAASTSADPTERLTAMMRAFVRHHARHHTTARVLNYELSALSPEHQQEIFTIRKAIDRLMLEVIEAGVARGQFHTSSPRMTSVALESLTIDVARWYRDDLPWTPEQIADHFGELALRMVGARDGGLAAHTSRPSPA
jgi:AcrR family transcriptional regulator